MVRAQFVLDFDVALQEILLKYSSNIVKKIIVISQGKKYFSVVFIPFFIIIKPSYLNISFFKNIFCKIILVVNNSDFNSII